MAFEIWTIEDLMEMKNHLSDRCVLMADIEDASGYYTSGFLGLTWVDLNWEPVGQTGLEFTGSFIGNGHVIKKLRIKNRDWASFLGICTHIGTHVTNGTFTGNANSWTLGTGWAYDTNNVSKNADGVGTLSQLFSDMVESPIIEERYILTYTISGHTVGTVTPTVGGVELTSQNANGTYSEEFVAISTEGISFLPSETSRFTIDNVVIKRIRVIEDGSLEDVFIERDELTGSTYCALFVSQITSETDSPCEVTNCTAKGEIDGLVGYFASIGGFCGNAVNVEFTECHSDVKIQSNGYANQIGGFISESTGAATTFSLCTSSGSILSTGHYNWGQPGYFAGFISAGSSFVANDCKSSVSIVHDSTRSENFMNHIGGFSTINATYNRCYSTGNIIANASRRYTIGGFGTALSGVTSKCFSTGNISCPTPVSSSGNVSTIGGFVAIGALTSDCYSRGSVCQSGISAGIHRIGGFMGHATGATTRCYSSGYVDSSLDASGGFAGSSAQTHVDCYYDEDASQHIDAIGDGAGTGITGLTTTQMKVASNFTNWDFDTVWEILSFLRDATAGATLTVWFSKTSDYDNFAEGVKDNDSFSLVIPSTNEIRWLGALEALLLGTAGDEWRIGSNRLDTALTPSNFKVAQQSEHGSSRIQPVKINSSLMFVDFVARKLREMTYVDPKYDSPDLTSLAEHITKHGITTMARQKNPDSIIWITLGNGELISMTYEREQDVVAWSKHPLGGDGFAQSVCVLPASTEDIIYLTVKRTIDSAEKVYIEKMAPRVFDTQADAFFVDCGITVSVTDSVSVTGISHLVGEKVAVVADGVVIYDGTEAGSVVSALGVVTLPAKITSTKVHVGLPYSTALKPMRLVLGDSMGSLTRINEIVVSFLNSTGVKYGNNLNDLYDIDFTDVRWTNTSDITGLFTGEVVVSMPGKIDPLNPIYIVSDQPTPCTVRCIVARADKTGR